MIDPASLAEMSVDTLSAMMDESEKKMVDVQKDLSTVTIRIKELQREKITIIGKIKELEIVEEKAKQLTRESRADFDFIKNAFFSARSTKVF